MKIETSVDVVEIKSAVPTPESPWLCRDKASDAVVLFTSNAEGIVLGAGKMGWRVGQRVSHWVVATNLDVWERLPVGSSVTLKIVEP